MIKIKIRLIKRIQTYFKAQETRKSFGLLFVICLLGLGMKYFQVWQSSVPFTYDQGRDLLDVRKMWLSKRPSLIGPTTSLHGVFYGPFWYWLILPFYVVLKGHPLSGLGALWSLSTIVPIIFWFLARDKDKSLWFILAFALTNPFFQNANHALNSHPLIYLYPLIFILVTRFLREKKLLYLGSAFFCLGAGFHFNFVGAGFLTMGILVSLLILRGIKLKKGFLKKWGTALFSFSLPFFPQLVFDFRHQFIQTKTFLKVFSGDTGSLMNLSPSLKDRFFVWKKILEINQGAQSPILNLVFLALVLLTALALFKKRNFQDEPSRLFLVSLIANLTTFGCILVAPFELWGWYLSSIRAGVVFLNLASVYWLLNYQKKQAVFLSSFLVLWLGWSIWNLNLWPLGKRPPADPANLRLRLSVVEQIYQDNQGEGLNVYSFAPHVYDYPYQYLIWYLGKERYGYLPEEYVYLPNKPDYVAAKNQADLSLPRPEAQANYLIIEPFGGQEDWYINWRGSFGQAQETWQIGETRIERVSLKKNDKI
ncbi:hypothetical protein ACFLZP_03710 [Patescibacteria group bacterium]